MAGSNLAVLSYPLFALFMYGYAVVDSATGQGILLVSSGIVQAAYRMAFQYPWKTRALLSDRINRPTLYLFVFGHIASYMSLPASVSPWSSFVIQLLVSVSTLVWQPLTLSRAARSVSELRPTHTKYTSSDMRRVSL